MISNPQIDEIRDSRDSSSSIKREQGRPFDDDGVGVAYAHVIDEDDDEIEILEGVKQTASGHLLV